MKPETAVMMTVSTAHVHQDEANPDDPTALYGRNIWTSEFGLIVHIDEQPWPNPEDYGDEPSEGLLSVVKQARAAGATWLRLDRDGPVLDHTPTYNW